MGIPHKKDQKHIKIVRTRPGNGRNIIPKTFGRPRSLRKADFLIVWDHVAFYFGKSRVRKNHFSKLVARSFPSGKIIEMAMGPLHVFGKQSMLSIVFTFRITVLFCISLFFVLICKSLNSFYRPSNRQMRLGGPLAGTRENLPGRSQAPSDLPNPT